MLQTSARVQAHAPSRERRQRFSLKRQTTSCNIIKSTINMSLFRFKPAMGHCGGDSGGGGDGSCRRRRRLQSTIRGQRGRIGTSSVAGEQAARESRRSRVIFYPVRPMRNPANCVALNDVKRRRSFLSSFREFGGCTVFQAGARQTGIILASFFRRRESWMLPNPTHNQIDFHSDRKI